MDKFKRIFSGLTIAYGQYQPGDSAYGIPYPGVYVINPDMEVVGKIFVEGYKKRVDALAVLTYAQQQLAQ